MKNLNEKAPLYIGLAAALTFNAHANAAILTETVIDFNDLVVSNGSSPISNPTIEDGISISAPTSPLRSANPGFFGNTNISVFVENLSAEGIISAEDNTPFALKSIDVDALFNENANVTVTPFPVTFIANTSSGGTATSTFVVDDIAGHQTFSFDQDQDNFGSVTNVSFFQGPTVETVFDFDNIVVDAPSVPEPTSAALLAVGGALLLRRPSHEPS